MNQNNVELDKKLSNEPKWAFEWRNWREYFINIIGQYYDFEPKRPKRLKRNQKNRRIFKKFNKNDPNQVNCLKNLTKKWAKERIEYMPSKYPINSFSENARTMENCYAENKLNNSELFPIIKTEKNQNSLVSGKTLCIVVLVP